MTALLLLSGGLDSTALAAWKRPDVCLTIDYGQAAASAEVRSARMIAETLKLPWYELSIDCGQLGQGTLAHRKASPHSLWEEFWPYRNQLLVTLAAGWGIQRDVDEIWTGTIQTDNRHVDGSSAFYDQMDQLLAMQEGQLRVSAPAINLACHELIEMSGVSDEVLSWTHSCHVSAVACANCAGCTKRRGALSQLGRLD